MSVRARGSKGNKREREGGSSSTPSPKNEPKKLTMERTDSQKIDELLTSMGSMYAVINDMKDKLCKQETEIKYAIEELKQKLEFNATQWATEKKQLIDRQKSLETRLNQLERRERKNNAIMKGLPATRESAKRVVNELLSSLTDPVEVEEVQVLVTNHTNEPNAHTKIRVQFKNFEDKIKVLRQKTQLVVKEPNGKSRNVYIDDDRSRREQEIYYHQRMLRKSLRDQNVRVRIRDERVCVGEEWRIWDDDTKTFVAEKN